VSRSIYIKVGFIVSFAALALVWGINFLKGKGMFNEESYYYVIYDRIDGLDVSNSVLINGFKVGQVSDIKFLPDTSGRLIVEFQIGNEYNLPGKTVAQIFSSDLMGTKSINLIFGDGKSLQNSGDTLIAAFEGSLTEMVSLQMLPLKNKAEDLMKEMEEAIAVVTTIFDENNRNKIVSSINHMKETFRNLETSTSSLDSIVQGGKTRMNNILKHTESISRNLEANNAQITNLLTNLSNISDSLAQAEIKQTVMNLNHVILDLNKITTKISAGEGSLGLLVNNDSLYNNLEDATYNLNRLLEDLRLNPKRYVHFSAWDLGKTVIVNDDRSTKRKKEKVSYTIQLLTSNKSIPLIPENFKGYKNVEEASNKGIYIYIYSLHKNIDHAKTKLKEVKGKFPGAIILKVSGGAYQKID